MRIVQAFTREDRNIRQLPRGHRALPRREHADGRPERRLLPVRRPRSRRSRSPSCSATAATSTSRARSTLGTLFAFMLYVQNFFDPVQQLSQLYSTFLSATAALDKIMDVLDEEPRGASTSPGASSCRRVEGTSASRTCASATATGPRCCTGSTSTSRRDDGRARRPHGRRQVDDREAARPLLRPDATDGSRSTAHDLRDVTQASLRRQLGIVPQEGFLFAGHRAPRTSPSAGPTRPPEDDRQRGRRRSARTSSSCGSRTATRRELQERGIRLSLGQRQLDRARARAARRPAHPDPRRGDLVGRHRHRAARSSRRCGAARRPDGVRHRAPPLDDPRRRPDRRPRARPGRRAGHATTS